VIWMPGINARGAAHPRCTFVTGPGRRRAQQLAYCYRQLTPNIGSRLGSIHAIVFLRRYLFPPARRFASPADLRTPRLQVTNQ
jgi:hypothetical protein